MPTMTPPTPAEREATQQFAIFNVLVTHCGERLTPDIVDKIRDEIVAEMRTGPTAWAFK